MGWSPDPSCRLAVTAAGGSAGAAVPLRLLAIVSPGAGAGALLVVSITAGVLLGGVPLAVGCCREQRIAMVVAASSIHHLSAVNGRSRSRARNQCHGLAMSEPIPLKQTGWGGVEAGATPSTQLGRGSRARTQRKETKPKSRSVVRRGNQQIWRPPPARTAQSISTTAPDLPLFVTGSICQAGPHGGRRGHE